MEKHCYNCQFSEGIEGKNETIGCKKDKRLHSAEDCCENHIFREEQSLRPQAEWLPRNSENPDCNVYYCSSCKMDISATEALYYKYCPECGAKMELENINSKKEQEKAQDVVKNNKLRIEVIKEMSNENAAYSLVNIMASAVKETLISDGIDYPWMPSNEWLEFWNGYFMGVEEDYHEADAESSDAKDDNY